MVQLGSPGDGPVASIREMICQIYTSQTANAVFQPYTMPSAQARLTTGEFIRAHYALGIYAYRICSLNQGDSNPPAYLSKLIDMYKSGQFPLDKISKVFPYTELDAALKAQHDGSVIKPIIIFD